MNPKQKHMVPKKAEVLFPTTNVTSCITAQAERIPHHPAVIAPSNPGPGSETFSFLDFEKRVNRVGNALKHLGIKKGDRIVLMVPAGLEHYLFLIGLIRIGGIAVYIDPGMGLGYLENAAFLSSPVGYLGSWKAQFLKFFSPSCRKAPFQWGLGCPSFFPTPSVQSLLNWPDESDCLEKVNGDDSALLTFTSGSTGKAKGADRTHGFLKAQSTVLNNNSPFTEEEIYMPAFPLVVLCNLAAGITSVIPDMDSSHPSRVSPEKIVRQIQNHRITVLSGSPAYAEPIADYCLQNHLQLNGVKNFYTGGAPVRFEIIQKLQKVMPDGLPSILYGSTEAEPISHIVASDLLSKTTRKLAARGGGNRVGKPVGDIEVRLINPDISSTFLDNNLWLREIKNGDEIGEIIVSGEHVNENYYQNPQAVRENKLVQWDKNFKKKIWHRTGDLARITQEGEIILLGRTTSRVHTPERILYTLEVENCANSHPWVEHSALIGGEKNLKGFQKAYLAVSLVKGESYRRYFKYRQTARLILRFLQKKGFPITQVFLFSHLPFDRRHNAKIEYPRLKKWLDSEIKRRLF